MTFPSDDAAKHRHVPSLGEEIAAEAIELAPAAPSRARGRALLLASLVLLGLNLRPAFSSLGPVLPELMADTGLSKFGASLLSTVPVLCLGVFGPLAPRLARRFGVEWAIVIALAILTVGTALRGIPTGPGQFVGAVLAGIAIGIGNVLVPGLIKRDFADRTALIMGVHTMMLCLGGALGAGVAVPLEHLLGGSWAGSLAFWAIPALAAALLWLPHLPRRGANGGMRRFVVRGLWRDPLAWQLTLFTAFQSAVFYAGVAWLPPIMRARGLDAEDAGLVVSISILVQLISSFAAPALATRGRDQRLPALAFEAVMGVGLLGVLYAPLSTVWVWSVVLGLGQGAVFALALTMIVLRARDSHVAAELSSMVQSVGYTVASLGSLAAGLVYGQASGREAVAGLFVVLIAAGSAAGWRAGRNVYVGAAVEAADS